LDIRTIHGFSVPKDKLFVLQHFNQPQIDPSTYRLKLSGMVNKPVELSLADLRKMRSRDLVAGYECSGNSLVPSNPWPRAGAFPAFPCATF
jgi:DMSO/TMAO reductase YedYZ molybdopterin-dependent catalytic subunit